MDLKIISGLLIEEFITILVWIIYSQVVWNLSIISGDWSGFYLFNTCMVLLTAFPIGWFVLISRQ